MSTERFLDVTQSRQTWRIPIIKPNLFTELMRVEPSGGQETGEYRPCQVELKDGSKCDHVLVAEAISHIFRWGSFPRKSISLLDVKHISSSPSRLPAHLADKLHRAGETNMGGISFGVVLRDGRTIWAVTGNEVIFLEYPPGVSAKDVVDVIHGWKDWNQTAIRSAPDRWCLYCLEPEAAKDIVDSLPAWSRGRITWKVAPLGSEIPTNPPLINEDASS